MSPLMQRFGWLRPVQNGQVPHGGEKAMITWSPGTTWVTPSPTSVTTPAPSCPRTAGGAWGIVPFMADRSEWQTPLWAIFTFTSPGAMSLRVTSSATTNSSVGHSMRIAASIGAPLRLRASGIGLDANVGQRTGLRLRR